jgi:hypothetical protein
MTYVRTALRYGTFWPGALAQDTYRMYKKRKSSARSGGPLKKRSIRYSRSYRPRMARKRRMTRKKGGKVRRWERNKRSIPNVRCNPFRFFRYNLTNASKVGASLETSCLTDIPAASRSLNNIMLKSFDIDLHFMPLDGCIRPTWVRFLIVVQTGKYILPNATELIKGTSHTDNFINMNTDREGWQNRTYAVNPFYKPIFAKTIKMAPLLEAGATSVQSNLNAQCRIRQRVTYRKYIQYDDALDNVADTNNVFFMYWFDDDFRNALTASTTTHRVMGDIKTNYRNTEF